MRVTAFCTSRLKTGGVKSRLVAGYAALEHMKLLPENNFVSFLDCWSEYSYIIIKYTHFISKSICHRYPIIKTTVLKQSYVKKLPIVLWAECEPHFLALSVQFSFRLWDLRWSKQWKCRLWPRGLWRRVLLQVVTDVTESPTAFIFLSWRQKRCVRPNSWQPPGELQPSQPRTAQSRRLKVFDPPQQWLWNVLGPRTS